MSDAGPVIKRLLEQEIESVLIVGVHTGVEAQPFIDAGKNVYGADVLPPYRNGYNHMQGRFETLELDRTFDAILCSHTLEHMESVGVSLRKFRQALKPGGWLGLVVPGYPQGEFFVGHLTLWTPALLLYNLATAGWDCREASYYTTADKKHIGLVVQNLPGRSAFGWDGWNDLRACLPAGFPGHKGCAWIPDRW